MGDQHRVYLIRLAQLIVQFGDMHARDAEGMAHRQMLQGVNGQPGTGFAAGVAGLAPLLPRFAIGYS